jgi:hypothetical protein
MVLSFSGSRCIDFTANLPVWVNLHLNLSSCGSNWTFISLCNRCSQRFQCAPTKERLNSILRGTEAKVCATIWSLCFTTLYNEGYWAAYGLSPNQVSSPNLILDPSPGWKSLSKKFILNPHEAFPEWWVCWLTNDLEQSFRMQVFVV